MKVNYKLLIDKADKNGLCPLFVRSKLSGVEFKYFTGEKCLPKDWDAEKQQVKRSCSTYRNINECLNKIQMDISHYLHHCKISNITPTVDSIKNALSPKSIETKKTNTDMFFEYYALFLQHLTKKGAKEASIKHYAITRNHLKKWGRELSVNNYTDAVHAEYLDYLRGLRDYHPNHLDNQGRNLKTFFFWGRDNGVFQLSEKHARLQKNYVEPERIWLTDDDLEKLKKVELSEALGRVRDTFLFGCYTGLRHSDLYRLSDDHIIDKGEYRVISIVPQKSVSAMRIAKRVQIPLIPEAEALIAKYKDYNTKTMPMLTNQRMNVYIKEIGKRAAIDYDVEVIRFEKSVPKIVLVPKYELLTCHITRHTFATKSLMLGMDIEVISKILGHSNIKQTLTYAKIVDEFKEKQMLEAWKK